MAINPSNLEPSSLELKQCRKKQKSSRNAVFGIAFIAIITTSLLIISVIYGSSAIVSVSYNFDDTNQYVPTQPIQINRNGTYASNSNATFTPTFLFIGLLYPKTDILYHSEFALVQYPNNIVSSDLINTINELDDYRDYFFASYIRFIQLDNNLTVKFRISADYTIFVKLIMSIDFINNTAPSETLDFVYIYDHARIGFLGRPDGQCTFDLENMNTFELNITGIDYDYQYIPNYFRSISLEDEVQPYPFILTGTHQSYFNLVNYMEVQ